MTLPEQAVLDEVTRVPGVRSALLVALEDGIVVAETALEGEDTRAAAALAARLAQRLSELPRTVGHPALTMILLQASEGQLFAAPGGDGLLLVAVADNDVNIGEVRLALLDAAGRLS
jgi:predicted regulator of Ras-like GTPase activity (Roadblock/LC7/MglB family)